MIFQPFLHLGLIQMGAGEIDIFAKNLREIGEIEMYEYVKDICACKESILRYFDNEEPETTEERIQQIYQISAVTSMSSIIEWD